jgi:hypothetical protein
MPAYLVQWPNGDFSVIEAETQRHAESKLDVAEGDPALGKITLLPRRYHLAFELWGEKNMEIKVIHHHLP